MNNFIEIKVTPKDSQILINRYTVNDLVFGDLIYHKPFTPYEPGAMKLICQRPFTSCEITVTGDVIVCCHDWLPLVIGNIQENTLEEIWNGEKANALRETVLNGSYKYCNNQTCLYLLAGNSGELVSKKKFKLPTDNLPRVVLLSVDESCNLYCPSCRSKKLGQLDGEDKEIASTIIKNVLQQICGKPHDQPVLIGFDGRGEVFNSAIYRHIFETEPIFSNLDQWPFLRFRILTNGVMMTEKIQTKYDWMFKRLEAISISIDAGNETAYNKVRLGGDWKLLLKNLDYLYKTQHSRSDFDWAWQIVLQEDNFETIPELVALAYKYTNKLPHIVISPILNWGTFTEDEFKEKSVWSKGSAKHARLLEILSMPMVAKYPKLTSPII